MPPGKTTKKKTPKRNVVELIRTASKNNEFAKSVLAELNKEKLKAEEFHVYLKGLGYGGVSLDDCKTLLRIVKDRGAIKPGVLERAY
jgi:hypothetical protein